MPSYADYFLPRPAPTCDPEAPVAFDALFARAAAAGDGAPIAYDLPWPRWQFICHIADTRPVIVHGSQNGEIDHFEPRKSNDVHPFGDRKAIFAASDGLWAMYYAILDRAKHPMLLVNSAMRFEAEGSLSEPRYFFSISRPALEARPFRAGTVYFLPRATFEPMPPLTVKGTRVHVAQWASLEAVRPVARIAVAPQDFPLLDDIRGHDDTVILERAKSDPDGFPWLDG